MKKTIYIVLWLCLHILTMVAQDSTRTTITYDLSAEMAVGSGKHTAYQLVANRHHVLATRPNTGYVRGAVTVEHRFSDDLKLSGAVDVIGGVHADHKAYLQQCYANLSYRGLFIEAGAREQKPVLRDECLSSGAFAKGANAKPIPQIHVGTNGFLTIPYSKGWLQVNADFGYGRLLDDGYRENRFYGAEPLPTSPRGWVEGMTMNGAGDFNYTTDIYYHQKHLFFRSNPDKRLFVTLGMEHVAMFAGKEYNVRKGHVEVAQKPAGLSAFTHVLLPVGDNNYHQNDSPEDWVYGNHLGTWTMQVGWNIDKDRKVQAYHDRIFEDGSGMRLGNGWDGLWGVEYKNRKPGVQYVRGIVAEYFQSTSQSGPLHWDPNDFDEPVKSQITSLVTGMDDYYNHEFYNGYSHYAMSLGTPLLTSPVYNADGSAAFRDNRVKAYHLAVNGDITSELSYLVKGSYKEGMGRYSYAIYPKSHSLDAMVQVNYRMGAWQLSPAYAFDKGNVYGDCSTFNVKVSYHGKIL